MNYLLFRCIMIAAFSEVFAKNCVVYKIGEEIPQAPGRECYNVNGDSNTYCVDYDCPTLECSNPLTPENGCPHCNGTCIREGKVRNYDESFTCPDGCNRCTCFFSTWMMCYKPEPPKECQNNEGKRQISTESIFSFRSEPPKEYQN